jgi:hypothetical protein
MIVAKIDRDYLKEPNEGIPSRVGSHWTHRHLRYLDEVEFMELKALAKTRFRLKDDDGQVYYGGWLLNDDMCEVQSLVLRWGIFDAGCTTIEVKFNNEWQQEIG